MQHVAGVPRGSFRAACKWCLTYPNQLAASTAIQTPTSATTRYPPNEHPPLSMVDRTCQFTHSSHTLNKAALYITAIPPANPATPVRVLISPDRTARCLSSRDRTVNQFSPWAARYLVSH